MHFVPSRDGLMRGLNAVAILAQAIESFHPGKAPDAGLRAVQVGWRTSPPLFLAVCARVLF